MKAKSKQISIRKTRSDNKKMRKLRQAIPAKKKIKKINKQNNTNEILNQRKQQRGRPASKKSKIKIINKVIKQKVGKRLKAHSKKQLKDNPKQQSINTNKNKKFYDQDFPPFNDSYFGLQQCPVMNQNNKFQWQSLTQSVKNPVLFDKEIKPINITQGQLRNCYFLSAIAAIAQKEQRIKKLFIEQKINSQKSFQVRLLYQGKMINVKLDDNIPVRKGKIKIGAEINSNQLWVAVLQKAWAKLYKGYLKTQKGFPGQVLHDLTGAPIQHFNLNQSTKQSAFSYLFSCQKLHPIVAGLKSSNYQISRVQGVERRRAYTVVDAFHVKINGEDSKIVKLRNPWGKTQEMEWLKKLDLPWNIISNSDKNQIGYNQNNKNGFFYMHLDNFVEQFAWFQSAKVFKNPQYQCISCKDQNINGVYFTLVVLKQNKFSIQLSKPPLRAIKKQAQFNYQYPQGQIVIKKMGVIKLFDYSNKNPQSLYSSYSKNKDRQVFHNIQLTEGTYVIKAIIKYDPRIQRNYEINLGIYNPGLQKQCYQIRWATNQEAQYLESNAKWMGRPYNSKGKQISQIVQSSKKDGKRK